MTDSNNGGHAARDGAVTVPPPTHTLNNNGGGGGGGVVPPVSGDIEAPPPVDVGNPQGQPTGDPAIVVRGPAGAQDGVGDAYATVGGGSAVAPTGGGIHAPGGGAGGAHEIGGSGGVDNLPKLVMSMMRPFVNGSSGPVVAQGANGRGGGGSEYRFTLTEMTVTRSDNSNASRPADVEANLSAGVRGGGGGDDADAQGPIDGERGIPDGGGRGGVRPNRPDRAVSTMLLAAVVLCIRLAGYAPTPGAVVVMMLALLSVAVDFLHRLDIIEMNCLERLGISSSAVEVGLYGFTWTCFTGLGIGGLVTYRPS
eukprot:g12005.t1